MSTRRRMTWATVGDTLAWALWQVFLNSFIVVVLYVMLLEVGVLAVPVALAYAASMISLVVKDWRGPQNPNEDPHAGHQREEDRNAPDDAYAWQYDAELDRWQYAVDRGAQDRGLATAVRQPAPGAHA